MASFYFVDVPAGLERGVNFLLAKKCLTIF